MVAEPRGLVWIALLEDLGNPLHRLLDLLEGDGDVGLLVGEIVRAKNRFLGLALLPGLGILGHAGRSEKQGGDERETSHS